MATLVIVSNASQGTDVTIADVGIVIPSSGGSVTFTEPDEIALLQQSDDLRAYIVDDAHGVGSSTLILNDGVGNIAQADSGQFLDTVHLPDSGNFSVLRRNDAGQLDVSVAFDGTATLSSVVLGNDLDANSQKITGLAAPTADNDAATKKYVDDRAAGIDWKESVRLSTTAALAANTAAGSGVGKTLTADANGALSVDSVAVSLNDRILVKNEATGADNGIYTVTDTGSAGTAWELTRAADADEDTEVTAGAAVFVTEGTTNGDTGWVLTTNDTITVDTTALVFTQFSGGNTITAGDGLTQNGTDFDVTNADGSLTIAADDVAVTFGAVSGIGASNANGSAASAARSDHVHAHGDRGADGAVSQHDADQIDVEGTFTNIGSPSNVETAVSNINDNFGDAKYIGRYIQFGSSNRVPSGGTLYLSSAGVPSSQVGARLPRAGTITAASIQVDTADASRAYNLSIQINGSQVATVALATTNTGAASTALNQTFSAGDRLSAALIQTSGSGFSTFDAAVALVEIEES